MAPTSTGHQAGRRMLRPGPAVSPVGGITTCTTGVDDYSRVVHSEILDDERKDTDTGFWTRPAAFFGQLGVTVEAVMTDNGACYRSHAFNNALGGDIKHRFTRAYRPQTSGKAERFNRTLMNEWAYARPCLSEANREVVNEQFLHYYNHHRAHTAIGGSTPSARVHNLTGNYKIVEGGRWQIASENILRTTDGTIEPVAVDRALEIAREWKDEATSADLSDALGSVIQLLEDATDQ